MHMLVLDRWYRARYYDKHDQHGGFAVNGGEKT